MKKDSYIKTGKLPFKVHKDVVSHLSIGLYRNFARAVKELLSNSYDAGAKEVKIRLDLDKDKIIVRDDGRGMDEADVANKFLNIGVPTPLTEKTDELGRKRIGTFGIGCLSVFPYCKTVRVISKKRGADQIIEVIIPAERFFKDGSFEITPSRKFVPFKIYKSDLPSGKGETIIILEDIKPHMIAELKEKEKEYTRKSSIDQFAGYHKFKWTLSQYIPVQFPPAREDLRDFFGDSRRVPMRVWLDGDELFRNVPEKAEILDQGEETFGNVRLRYVIMTPMEPVKPGELKGFQIRLRDVAIGLPTDFNIISLTGKVPGKLNWICGEVHILAGLDSAIMIDRDSFSFTQDVAEMQSFFRKKLRKWNDTLEKWASEDKNIYGALLELKGADEVLEQLKLKGVLRIPKERLRIQKHPIVKTRRKEISSPSEKIGKALSKTGYRITSTKQGVPEGKAPVEIDTRNKQIVVYEHHPAFAETIAVSGKEFIVGYDKWDHKRTPFSICKLDKENQKVVFNISHPIFGSQLSDEIIKRLAVGILVVVEGLGYEDELVRKLYCLLEEIFVGR